MNRSRGLALAVALALSAGAPLSGQTKSTDHWVTTWATSVVARPQPAAGRGQGGGSNAPAPPAAGAAAPAPAAGGAAAGRQGGGPPPVPPVTITNQTLRQVVHTSVGGSRARVVLSNAFGSAPIQIGAAHLALRGQEASIVAASAKPLTVSGQREFAILPGATVVSDPVEIAVAPLSDLVIDLYVPGELGVGPSPVTYHQVASQTNYLSDTGNHAGAASFTVTARPTSWMLLSRVEVIAPARVSTIVTFGDSITDGTRSTVDVNARWPDVLARRLAADRNRVMSVSNQGISGNRVLGDGSGVSALARFDRDALMQTGVTHVVVMEGINDIGLARQSASPTPDDIIAGYKQLIARAHARGLKVIGATLTPYEGAFYYSAEGEAKRQAVNTWIRTSGAYDGVIDFDKVVRDPAAPSKILPAYDSGDHLHPSDIGYKAMGDAVDLGMFR